MVFNSLHFAGFFVVVYLLYRALPHRWQNWLLLAASYYFYAAWDWRFLGLLAASTVVPFYAARFMAKHDARGPRRAALVVSLGFNLAVLGFFKDFNFFAENLHAIFAAAGFRLDVVTLRVLLPIGISFYTFMTMSYVVDVYRRQIPPADSLRDFAVFVAYFPHLVAGPILRASALLPQIVLPRRVTRDQVIEGAWLIGVRVLQEGLRRRQPRVPHGRRLQPRRTRPASSCCSRSTPSRFRSTATSPATPTWRAACRNSWESS